MWSASAVVQRAEVALSMSVRRRWLLAGGGVVALLSGVGLTAAAVDLAGAVFGWAVLGFGAAMVAMTAPLPIGWRMGLGALFFALSCLSMAVVATFFRDSLPLDGASRRSLTRGNAPIYASVAWFGALFFGTGAVLSAWAFTRTAIDGRRDSGRESMG